jgi:deazaflavin-dependent oxidoreductase (nitroreductase family)
MHLFWLRVSGGRLWSSVLGGPVLILTTTGRKSRTLRSTPLLYVEDGDNFVVIASFGGHDVHPSWFLNLRENPQAEVQIRGKRTPVRAEVAQGAERERLWAKAVEMYGNYDDYQRSTKRQIPVVVLRPETIGE